MNVLRIISISIVCKTIASHTYGKFLIINHTKIRKFNIDFFLCALKVLISVTRHISNNYMKMISTV